MQALCPFTTHHPAHTSRPACGGAVLSANLSQVVSRRAKHFCGVGASAHACGVGLDLRSVKMASNLPQFPSVQFEKVRSDECTKVFSGWWSLLDPASSRSLSSVSYSPLSTSHQGDLHPTTLTTPTSASYLLGARPRPDAMPPMEGFEEVTKG